MNPVVLFRTLVVVGTISYIPYLFLPYTYGYLDSFTGSLLAYSGFNAIVTLPTILGYAMFIGWLVAAVGLFFFYTNALRLFVILVVGSLFLGPLSGIHIETAGGATLLAITCMADGAILALAYFSPVKDEFG